MTEKLLTETLSLNTTNQPLHSNYLIFFCSSISCPLSLAHLFHSNDLIQFCSSISCLLSLAHLFHSNDFIQFCSSISCSLSLVHHSIQIISLSEWLSLEHPFHSYLILFCSSISCPPIPFKLSHSLLFINFMPIISFHSDYLIFFLFINLMSTIPGTPIPFSCLWNTHSILISFSFVHQSHAHYLWYTYSIQSIPFAFIHQSHAHYLWYLFVICKRNRSSPDVGMLVFQPRVTDLIDK